MSVTDFATTRNLPATVPKTTTRFTNDVDDVQNITEAIV